MFKKTPTPNSLLLSLQPWVLYTPFGHLGEHRDTLWSKSSCTTHWLANGMMKINWRTFTVFANSNRAIAESVFFALYQTVASVDRAHECEGSNVIHCPGNCPNTFQHKCPTTTCMPNMSKVHSHSNEGTCRACKEGKSASSPSLTINQYHHLLGDINN